MLFIMLYILTIQSASNKKIGNFTQFSLIIKG